MKIIYILFLISYFVYIHALYVYTLDCSIGSPENDRSVKCNMTYSYPNIKEEKMIVSFYMTPFNINGELIKIADVRDKYRRILMLQLSNKTGIPTLFVEGNINGSNIPLRDLYPSDIVEKTLFVKIILDKCAAIQIGNSSLKQIGCFNKDNTYFRCHPPSNVLQCVISFGKDFMKHLDAQLTVDIRNITVTINGQPAVFTLEYYNTNFSQPSKPSKKKISPEDGKDMSHICPSQNINWPLYIIIGLALCVILVLIGVIISLKRKRPSSSTEGKVPENDDLIPKEVTSEIKL